MVYSGLMGQTSFSRVMPVGMPGTLEGMAPARVMPYMNQASARQAVYTVTPPATVDASATYSLAIDGVTVSVSSGGSPTTASLGALLYNALRAEPLVFRKFEIALNAGSGVVTLTHRFYNIAATITSPSNASTTNDLVIANTVAVGTDVRIPFGRFVGRLSSYTVDADGVSNAALIDHASNYTVLGVTMKQVYEKDKVGPDAAASYPSGVTMNVCQSVGTNKGIWVECVEPDIIQTDTLYIEITGSNPVTGSNAGMVTKTSSGKASVPAGTKALSRAQVSYLGTSVILIGGFEIRA